MSLRTQYCPAQPFPSLVQEKRADTHLTDNLDLLLLLLLRHETAHPVGERGCGELLFGQDADLISPVASGRRTARVGRS